MTLEQLIHKYELDAQHIADDMEHHEKWGAGPYYRHKLAMIKEFVRALKAVEETDGSISVSTRCGSAAIKEGV